MVERSDTAVRVGSGDVPVLATPRLLAIAEAVCVEAVADALPEGRTTVGTRVDLEHTAASAIGMHVAVSAELREVDGRRLVFAVAASDRHGTAVASGTLERVVVDRERFLARLPG